MRRYVDEARSPRHRFVAALAGTAVVLGAGLSSATAPAVANSGGSAPGVYLSMGQSVQPGQPPLTQLMRGDANSSGGLDFTAVGAPYPGSYNALGAHLPTNTLYAIDSAAQTLVSIDPSGSVHEELVLGETSFAGAFAEGAEQDRFYYILQGSNQLAWVNVVTQERGSDAMTGSFVPIDFVFSDGAFWGLHIGGDDQAQLSRVGLDGQVAVVPIDFAVERFRDPTTHAMNTAFGGAWKYGNGNLGFSNNDGGILQIRLLDTGAMTAEEVGYSASPSSSSVDATAIPYAPADLGVQIRTERSGPGVPLTLHATVRNESSTPSSGYVLDLNSLMPDSRQVDLLAGCEEQGTGFSCAGGVLQPGGERVHSLVVTYQAGDTDISWAWAATVLGNEADPVSGNDNASIVDSVGGDIGIRVRLQDANGNGRAEPRETFDAFGVIRNDSSVTIYSGVVHASGLLKDSHRLDSPMLPGEQRTVRFAGVMPTAAQNDATDVIMEFLAEADGVPLQLGDAAMKLVGVTPSPGGGSGGNGGGSSGSGGGNGSGTSGGGGQGSGGGFGEASANGDVNGDANWAANGRAGLSATGSTGNPLLGAGAIVLVAGGLVFLMLRRRPVNRG